MRGEQKSTHEWERLTNARRVFCDTLALFVGAGRMFAIEDIAAASGITPDTLRRYLRRESCPEWANAIAIMSVLPPEFAAAVLRPAGLTGLRRVDGESTAAETLREVVEGAAALAAAMADGRIDHTEVPAIRRELTEAMVAIAQFLKDLQAEVPPR